MDLFVLRAVGNDVSSNIDTTLCLEALRMAIAHRTSSKGIIHHSDRGVQYASHEYVEMLLKHGFRISMARKGNPYDNATAESFIKTLKTKRSISFCAQAIILYYFLDRPTLSLYSVYKIQYLSGRSWKQKHRN